MSIEHEQRHDSGEPLFAHSLWMGRCGNPQCQSVHLDLLDRTGDVIACASVGRTDIASMISKLQDLAYEIATERKA